MIRLGEPLPCGNAHEAAARAMERAAEGAVADVAALLRDAAAHMREVGRHALQRGESGAEREKVYDEQIAPLMAQIVEVAKVHAIPMIASFDLGGGCLCTTAMGDPAPMEFRVAAKVIVDGFAPFPMARGGAA